MARILCGITVLILALSPLLLANAEEKILSSEELQTNDQEVHEDVALSHSDEMQGGKSDLNRG